VEPESSLGNEEGDETPGIAPTSSSMTNGRQSGTANRLAEKSGSIGKFAEKTGSIGLGKKPTNLISEGDMAMDDHSIDASST